MPTVNSASGNITGYNYNPNTRDLIVEFHGGRTYTYRGVPEDVAEALGSAESAGRYLNASIKGTYAVDRGGTLRDAPGGPQEQDFKDQLVNPLDWSRGGIGNKT